MCEKKIKTQNNETHCTVLHVYCHFLLEEKSIFTKTFVQENIEYYDIFYVFHNNFFHLLIVQCLPTLLSEEKKKLNLR